jgi:L-Ala-D/L-Glu epimerase
MVMNLQRMLMEALYWQWIILCPIVRNNAQQRRVTVGVTVEEWPYLYPFRITGYEWTHCEVLVVELESEGAVGRGECAGVYYLGDTLEQCRSGIELVADEIRSGADREELLALLPPGGARNALDCALWDLEAKLEHRAAWKIAGLSGPHPVVTTCTLGADLPVRMAERARSFVSAKALKLKLTGDDLDAERVSAVREARTDVWLAVDGNQGFNRDSLDRLMPTLVSAGVQLLEQPFPRDRNADLKGLQSPVPIAADESAQDLKDLAGLAGLVDVVNIKLDKCGGLTRGLAMEQEARRLGLKTMVGCMGGTSLAMAPAFLLAQRCEIADLDGPLLLSKDRSPSVVYESGTIFSAEDVWGGPSTGSG